MSSTVLLSDFDLPTRSASGYLLRWIVPRIGLEPATLYGMLARKLPFDLAAPQSDIIIAMGHGSECYSNDTEILTEDGWKLFANLNGYEKVATLNPQTDELEYQDIIHRFVSFYEGKMFYQNGAVDLLVTPNHNLYCSWLVHGDKYRPFTFIKPEELGSGVTRDEETGRFLSSGTTEAALKYKRNAKWQGEEKQYFILPPVERMFSNQSGRCTTRRINSKRIKMDEFLRFFGIWLAEGCTCFDRHYRITITQNNDEKRELIKRWLQPIADQVGFKFWEHKNSHSRAFEFRNKQMFSYLKQFGKAKDKYVPKDFKNLPSRQLRILLEAMMLGDGSDWIYSTSSKKLADDVQEIALKAGYAASVRKIPTPHSGFDAYSELYSVTICSEARLEPVSMKKGRGFINYRGPIYSVEVLKHHTLYVRRNGKPCWSGNSTLTGQNEAVILDAGKYDAKLVNGKVVRLLACQVGSKLGPDIISNGAVCFIGHKDDFVWVCDADLSSTPWSDEMAAGALMPVVDSLNALLDGKTCVEAYQIERSGYLRNAVDEENELIKACLEFNYDNLVLLGNPEARVKARPKIVFPIAPPPLPPNILMGALALPILLPFIPPPP